MSIREALMPTVQLAWLFGCSGAWTLWQGEDFIRENILTLLIWCGLLFGNICVSSSNR
eukprot:m.156894 g.156894  ORF g.156894 m.156894 type:complete len:58 (-) comp52939_c0_seq23:384-557(-)